MVGYEFNEKFSGDVVVIKNHMKIKSRIQSDLVVKSNSGMVTFVGDYKALKWLTLNLTYTRGKSKTDTYSSAGVNKNSISKSVTTNPKFTLKFTVPLPNNIIFLPEIGLSRSYSANKSYLDNNGNIMPKRTIKRNDLSLGAKLAYPVTDYFAPYISAGYDYVIKYGLSQKSRNTYRSGAGAIFFKGLLSLDWSYSKANASVISKNISATASAKF